MQTDFGASKFPMIAPKVVCTYPWRSNYSAPRFTS